jgi:hypothetical protein
MSKQNPTFEEVNAHIEKADLKKLQKATGGSAESLTAAGVGGQVCAGYKVVRPILLLVSSLPLIPSKWKAAIKAFIAIMDGFCPGA